MLTVRELPGVVRARGAVERLTGPGLPTAVAVALVLGYLASLAWASENVSYDVWGALLISPVLVALVVPFALAAARHEADQTMVRIVIGALVLKLFMSLVRYAVAFELYGGSADASRYHDIGRALSTMFRAGDFRTMGEPLTSTGFINVLTGAVYTVIGPTKLGGFLVFAWLSFIGLWLFYRAFHLAVPDGNIRRYALLLFFLPSTLYWPSSIGKDAWMCFSLGLAAYGAARMLANHRSGMVLFVIGTALGAVVRPHVALMLFLGVSIAYLIRRPARRPVLGPITKVAAVLVLALVGALLLNRVEEGLEVNDLAAGGFDQALDKATTQSTSSEGGSSFTPTPVTNPLRFGWAAVTVLFRPFPYEAGNAQSLLSSMEGLLVFGLVLLSVGNGLRLLANMRTWSYGVTAVVYALVFCYTFASIGNFGILARQRVQVLPFLLVLVCIPAAPIQARFRRRAPQVAPAPA